MMHDQKNIKLFPKMFQPQIKNLQKTNGVHKYIDYRKLLHIWQFTVVLQPMK